MYRSAIFASMFLCIAFLSGCGSSADEKAPLDDPGTIMSQDEQERVMKESMERGGAGNRYRKSK